MPSIAQNILERYATLNIKVDKSSNPHYEDVKSYLSTFFNDLPKKAKCILIDITYYICFSKSIQQVVNSKEHQHALGITKPNKDKIYLNIQRLVNDQTFTKSDFEKLFYHEVGHYLISSFNDLEKKVYKKFFGNYPSLVGEPEADGFAAYMKGVAPRHIQEFWAWWLLTD